MSLRSLSLVALALGALDVPKPVMTRQPVRPDTDEWRETYEMLCGHCEHQLGCDIVERMIEMKNGGPWPEGGWVTDPGAEVTCLSYEPVKRPPMVRQQLRALLRRKDADMPPICAGCAARKGSEASLSLHTQRDFQSSVRDRAPFLCHEDPEKKRLCGGWCDAIRRRAAS